MIEKNDYLRQTHSRSASHVQQHRRQYNPMPSNTYKPPSRSGFRGGRGRGRGRGMGMGMPRGRGRGRGRGMGMHRGGYHHQHHSRNKFIDYNLDSRNPARINTRPPAGNQPSSKRQRLN